MSTSRAAGMLVGFVPVLFALLVHAAPEQPPGYAYDIKCTNEELLTHYPLPAGLSKETVLRDLLEKRPAHRHAGRGDLHRLCQAVEGPEGADVPRIRAYVASG